MANDIKQFIDEYKALLPLNKSISTTEAEKRAAKFLEAMAVISDWKHSFIETKIGQLSTQTAVYAQELAKGTAKTVTENKTTAEASEAYAAAREALEFTENDITYLKAYFDIFTQAHLLYRNLAKGVDNFG